MSSRNSLARQRVCNRRLADAPFHHFMLCAPLRPSVRSSHLCYPRNPRLNSHSRFRTNPDKNLPPSCASCETPTTSIRTPFTCPDVFAARAHTPSRRFSFCQIYSDLCASPRPHVQRIRPLLRLYPIPFHFCYGSPPQKSPMFTGLVTGVTDVTGFWKGGGGMLPTSPSPRLRSSHARGEPSVLCTFRRKPAVHL